MAKSKRKARLKRGTKDLAKPKSQVSLSRWDQGASGVANRVGLVTEDRGDTDPESGKKINPNGIRGVRRVDMLEVYGNRGWITKRGLSAAEALRNAWEATQRGKGADLSDVRVDRTPKPDASIDVQIDRVSLLVGISRLVPKEDRDIIFAVACEGRAVGHLRQYRGSNHDLGKSHLHEATERLAEKLGY